MSKRLTSGIVATVVAVAMSVPAVGLADRGGHPHTTPPKCGAHHHGKKNGSHRGKKMGAGKGNKCGS